MSTVNKELSLIFKRKSFHQLLGSYQSNFKGSGLVYKESRPYAAGDPYHRIDRRTSAKKQELFLKEFEEERMLRVLFVTHGGESINFTSCAPTKRDMISTLGTLIGTIALNQGDQISYYGHTASDSFFLPLTKSAHQTKWFDQKINDISFTGYPSGEETACLLNQYRIRHHLIVWVSDQLVTKNQVHLQALAQCNDVLYCHLFDPFEYDADMSRFGTELTDLRGKGLSKAITKVDTLAYSERFITQVAESERQLTSRGITSTHASTQDNPLHIFSKLFQKHALKR